MVAIRLASFDDVRTAREWVGCLAEAAGIEDPGAAVQATAELGNNCVEHGSEPPALLWVGCGQGRLSLRFENSCAQPPEWCTRKPMAVAEYRTGGYGLQIARALARSVNCRWIDGRVIVRAEFD